ncbi:MAG: hypothetical protein ACPGSB_11775, partial [Opitutales bacterium]
MLLCLAAQPYCYCGELVLNVNHSDLVEAYAARRLQASFRGNLHWPDTRIQLRTDASMDREAFRIGIEETKPLSVVISGGEGAGLLYGSLELLEQLSLDPNAVHEVEQSPRFPFRAIKFNLPFMSYRTGDALMVHYETCRDLKFWEAFLDMMADNRFNSLTLWSLHPFHYMIRNEVYPEACGLTDDELQEWQRFWRALFRMAKERGIHTYLVNWNIFVSPEFARHHGVAAYSRDWHYIGDGDTSELVKDYMRSTVTQVLDSYPNLTGLGISLGERMGGMTPEDRQEWILDVFVEGIEAASRSARLIHRLPFSATKSSGGSGGLSNEQMTRKAIESINFSEPIITEAKFNWSHGHSTPKLIKVHGGRLGDTYWNPPPTNYTVNWMIRNEDFFALRWCEPDFIRKHIEQNGASYVGGYYVGSECYIPAFDYITVPEKRGGYAFERQWLFYQVWGRLLYDPGLPDEFFIRSCEARYGVPGEDLFQALKLGSRMPLRMASFFNASWDFTLYSEGFQSIRAKSNPERLITVEELIKARPLEPDYQSISDYVASGQPGRAEPNGKITPLELADLSIADGRRGLAVLAPLLASPELNEGLALELADAKAWAHLSIYFGEKLRAAVALRRFREQEEPE